MKSLATFLLRALAGLACVLVLLALWKIVMFVLFFE